MITEFNTGGSVGSQKGGNGIVILAAVLILGYFGYKYYEKQKEKETQK